MTLLEKKILAILSEPQLTYPQRLKELAAAAENMPDPVTLSPEAQWFADRDIIFDMREGNAPYRPRYVRFMRQM